MNQDNDAPSYRAPAGACIGHVHLKVANLSRAMAFYRDVLGFGLMAKMGDSAAFLGAGDYHHHIGLNIWESRNGTPPPPGCTGIYHLAILYPTRKDLAVAVRRALDAGTTFVGAADHGVSEAVYFEDPDSNGVELYWDRPRDQWPKRPDGSLDIYTHPLDLPALLKLGS
jgi:catechol 2,3-dioxygenase